MPSCLQFPLIFPFFSLMFIRVLNLLSFWFKSFSILRCPHPRKCLKDQHRLEERCSRKKDETWLFRIFQLNLFFNQKYVFVIVDLFYHISFKYLHRPFPTKHQLRPDTNRRFFRRVKTNCLLKSETSKGRISNLRVKRTTLTDTHQQGWKLGAQFFFYSQDYIEQKYKVRKLGAYSQVYSDIGQSIPN